VLKTVPPALVRVNKMAEEALFGGKKITELRVVDLRQELEKRGLEKSGVKAVLIERLQKVCERYFFVYFRLCFLASGTQSRTKMLCLSDNILLYFSRFMFGV